ncbi:MAG: hypothetical protein GY755_16610 [Chloroflexi bacterium]|nr:hypothetical protein [Chloroflexota bacterium]
MLQKFKVKENALQKFLAGRNSRQADWQAICTKNPENMMFSGQIHSQCQDFGIA